MPAISAEIVELAHTERRTNMTKTISKTSGWSPWRSAVLVVGLVAPGMGRLHRPTTATRAKYGAQCWRGRSSITFIPRR